MSTIGFSQGFEGEIKMTETHRGNVILKHIYVKGDMVKIETYADEAGTDLKGAKIIDLKSGKITALMPSRKLYFDLPNKPHRPATGLSADATEKTKNVEVQSGDGKKGFTCNQVIVKHAARKVAVSYWIAKGNFDFFGPMIKVLDRREDISNFYDQLVEKHPGAMPLISVERRADGTEVTRRTVTEINEKTIDESTFEVPADYTLQER